MNKCCYQKKALSPAEAIFNDTNNLPLEYGVFLNFVKESKINPNIVNKTKELTDNVTILTSIIDEPYPLVINIV